MGVEGKCNLTMGGDEYSFSKSIENQGWEKTNG